MSDMMEFPQTVEEFMEQYKVVDSDHIYSNGIAFVPIFRMKQWFNHVEVKHGEWIKHGLGHENVPCGFDCSKCKEWFVIDSKFIGRYKYCPNCGAMMFASDTNVLNKDEYEDDSDWEEPANLEMGYDPYLGCYTDDC